MPTVEETVIQDKIERAHRSRENEYNKNRQSSQNLMTASSRSQSKPASSERNHRYVFRKFNHLQ